MLKTSSITNQTTHTTNIDIDYKHTDLALSKTVATVRIVAADHSLMNELERSINRVVTKFNKRK